DRRRPSGPVNGPDTRNCDKAAWKNGEKTTVMPIRKAMQQGLKRAVITGGLEAARLVERAGLMTAARGMGAIFTLHHVRPRTPQAFDPNAHLEITPEFLDAAIGQLAEAGYRFVPLAEMPAHIA